jgi:cysteinyl-tRNA synthetase
VDDKLIAQAHKNGTTVKDLAEKMTADYFDCLKKLNVIGVDQFPRATEHIPEMIAMMEGLIANGHAYAAGGDVYFDIASDPDYGKLCNRDPEQLEAGARIEVSDKKRSPGDFALWKAAKPGEPAWDSPWGKGRPGWHIECSAMSMKLLGETLDIHGGGLDLQFPHHENELAQSESFTGKPFARIWMHNGLLKMGTTKMAGSIGNVVNIGDLLQRHDPETVRFLLLSTHYRTPIEYSDDRLTETARALQSFYRFFERYERITGSSFFVSRPSADAPAEFATLRARFLDCMDDDFNTGGAVGVLFELLSALNRLADAHKLEEPGATAGSKDEFIRASGVLRELSALLGLFWQPVAESKCDDKLHASLNALAAELSVPAGGNVNATMAAFIRARADARRAKNFALSDLIRKRLSALGVTLEDRPGGKTDWRMG